MDVLVKAYLGYKPPAEAVKNEAAPGPSRGGEPLEGLLRMFPSGKIGV